MSKEKHTPSEIIPRHKRAYDLGDEPWIPVRLDGGEMTRVGLRRLFREAHLVKGLALDSPIEEGALLRYLVALTMVMFAEAPQEMAEATALSQSHVRFPETALRRLDERMREHWWLFHPDTPFLQDPLLLTAKVMSKEPKTVADVADPIASAWSHIPAKSKPAFFNKEDGTNSLRRDVTFDRAAFALLVRHYASLPGNEANIEGSAGAAEKYTQGGVFFVVGNKEPLNVTHVFREAATLAQTLVANIPPDRLATLNPKHRCAWEVGKYDPSLEEDPLFLYTYGGSASYLIQELGSDTVSHLIRAPVPRYSKENRNRFASASRRSDPHAVRALKDKNAKPSAPKDFYYLFWAPGMQQLEWVSFLFEKAVDPSHLFCLLRPSGRQDRTVFLSLETGGTSSGVTVVSASWMPADTSLFFLEDDDRRALIKDILGVFAGPTKSVRSTLRHHVRRAISESAEPEQLSAATRQADTALWEELSADLSDLVAEAQTIPVELLAEVDLSKLLAQRTADWVSRVDRIFCSVVEKFVGGSRSLMQFVETRNRLRRKLWEILTK